VFILKYYTNNIKVILKFTLFKSASDFTGKRHMYHNIRMIQGFYLLKNFKLSNTGQKAHVCVQTQHAFDHIDNLENFAY